MHSCPACSATVSHQVETPSEKIGPMEFPVFCVHIYAFCVCCFSLIKNTKEDGKLGPFAEFFWKQTFYKNNRKNIVNEGKTYSVYIHTCMCIYIYMDLYIYGFIYLEIYVCSIICLSSCIHICIATIDDAYIAQIQIVFVIKPLKLERVNESVGDLEKHQRAVQVGSCVSSTSTQRLLWAWEHWQKTSGRRGLDQNMTWVSAVQSTARGLTAVLF